jgi:hypothetical protein
MNGRKQKKNGNDSRQKRVSLPPRQGTHKRRRSGCKTTLGEVCENVVEIKEVGGGERGLWTKSVMLVPGRYEYKFLVHGQWLNIPVLTSCC